MGIPRKMDRNKNKKSFKVGEIDKVIPDKLKKYEREINNKSIWTYKCVPRLKTIYENNEWKYELHIGIDRWY